MNKPVVACDIDGTLGDWHAHFLAHAAQWSGRPMPAVDEINPGLPLHKFLGMSKSTYRQCKLAFRQGGWKRSMPVYPYAADMTREIRRAGAELWLCTTRPYIQFSGLDDDTRHWTRRNGIQFDGLLYGEHKYNQLVKEVGKHRIIGVLDDLPEQCAVADKLGLNVYIRSQPYNHHVDFPRVASLETFRAEMIKSIKSYKLERV